jgi:hypothetical protein
MTLNRANATATRKNKDKEQGKGEHVRDAVGFGVVKFIKDLWTTGIRYPDLKDTFHIDSRHLIHALLFEIETKVLGHAVNKYFGKNIVTRKRLSWLMIIEIIRNLLEKNPDNKDITVPLIHFLMIHSPLHGVLPDH